MTDKEKAVLAAELKNDPAQRGYPPDDEAAAATFSRPDRTRRRADFSAWLFVSCLDLLEFVALLPDHKLYVKLLVTAAAAGPSATVNDNVRLNISAMFPPGSKTRANLTAALVEPCNRAQELGIPIPTTSHVADARRQ